MRTGFVSILSLFVFWPLVGLAAPARGDVTELISVDARGSVSGGYSFAGGMSTNGRYIAFYSGSDDLVANDTNDVVDVFVRDRRQGTTRRVSVGARGQQANGASSLDAITPDGRFVLFVGSVGRTDIPTATAPHLCAPSARSCSRSATRSPFCAGHGTRVDDRAGAADETVRG